MISGTMINFKYRPNKNKESETWFHNGIYHREDGPAVVTYFNSGSVFTKQWFLNGKLHRDFGPAFILYDADHIIRKTFWVHNGQFDKNVNLDIEKWINEKNVEVSSTLEILNKRDRFYFKLHWAGINIGSILYI